MQKNKCCNNCTHSCDNSIPNDEYEDIIWLECDLLKKVVNEEDGENCEKYEEYNAKGK